MARYHYVWPDADKYGECTDERCDRQHYHIVNVDEYAALIRARDILANPEHLADDIVAAFADYYGDYGSTEPGRHIVLDCLRRAAADSGTVDDRSVQH